MRLVMLQRRTVKNTLCVEVYIGSHRALKMGQHNEPVGAGCHTIGLLAHQVVCIHTGEVLDVQLRLAEPVPEPAQAHAAGGEGVHHICVRGGKIVHRHLAVGIVGQL